MAIFPILEVEALVQHLDKTRLNASRSYVSPDKSITKIEIKPTATDSYIDVTSTGYLDWSYTQTAPDATTGKQTFTATVRVTDNAAATATLDASVITISSAKDALFSNDDNLRKHRYDILKYLPDGRATFKDIHRRAQDLILAWLDKEGYVDTGGNKFTKVDLVDISEVSDWATFLALRLIFENLSNEEGDIFEIWAKKYDAEVSIFRDRAILRIDIDGDGALTTGEGVDIRSGEAYRR